MANIKPLLSDLANTLDKQEDRFGVVACHVLCLGKPKGKDPMLDLF